MNILSLIVGFILVVILGRVVRRTLRSVPRTAWREFEGHFWLIATLLTLVLGHTVVWWLEVSP